MNHVARLYDRVRHAVRYFLLRRLPTCRAITPVISESMERPLALRERILVRLHLGVCVWCVWYSDQLKVIRSLSRSRAGREPGMERRMPDEARERIRRALEESRQR